MLPLDTALIMAADTISSYIQELPRLTKGRLGPLPEECCGRRSREEVEEERRLAAWVKHQACNGAINDESYRCTQTRSSSFAKLGGGSRLRSAARGVA